MMAILWGCCYRESSIIIDGEKRILKPGQWLTSIDRIRKLAGKGVSSRNVRTALKTLELSGFLTNEVTKGNKRIITVNNWINYQEIQVPTNEVTDDPQTTDRRPTNDRQTTDSIQRSKEVKEVKRNKNKILYEHDLYESVFAQWHEHEILMNHTKSYDKKKFRDTVVRHIKNCLDYGLTLVDICDAIDKYAEAREKEGFYAWTLIQFLQRESGCRTFFNREPWKGFSRDLEKKPDQLPIL